MDYRVPVDGGEDLGQVEVEPEVMPDERGVCAGEGEAVSSLCDADQVPAHDPPPCIPLPLPAEDLAAREGEVEVERLVWFENDGMHVKAPLLDPSGVNRYQHAEGGRAGTRCKGGNTVHFRTAHHRFFYTRLPLSTPWN